MKNRFNIFIFLLLATACSQPATEIDQDSVSGVMDEVISRLYREVPPEQYPHITDEFILNFLTQKEKTVLATQYLYFTVNVPVVVSLMHHQDQRPLPFWLEGSGFVKTGKVVKSESFVYDVWEKKFETGKIELGINGFDKHRPVYFICVGPQDENDLLTITDPYPAEYTITTMRKGAFTYHDWSDLELVEVPESLEGQKLFTTVRGRAREAHVKGAFRKTPYPSSKTPDQVMLTWSDSPQTTLDIQWRTNTTVQDGVVRFWATGNKQKADTLVAEAFVYRMQDRMLMNDRYINRFTAQLKNLSPGTEYSYRVGSRERKVWSEVASFKTEGREQSQFSFIWFGDTHCFPDSGKLVNLARKHQGAAFYSIAGDLVSTGLNRDDWDRLFQHAGSAFSFKPLMPVPGNHDRQDGLGAKMYYDLFSLPENGPEGVDLESSYSFEYGNALFLMIDATSDVGAHTRWVEEKLKNTKAVWKFVMFHFAPYNFEEPYPEIQEAWVPLFDRYHVDLVMGGHVHYYMRSQPMNGGQVVDSFRKGTVYAISISIPAKHENMASEPYAVKQYPEGYYYQHVELKGNVLKHTTFDETDKVRDEFVITK